MRLRSKEAFAQAIVNANITRTQLAAGRCHKSFISNLCSGEKAGCGPELAARLAAALDVKVHHLFEIELTDTDRQAVNRRRRAA